MVDEGHRVELDAYSGPMDLLLYLVQKEEVDVHDIPVARILEKYLEALRTTEALDLDRAGEFLVMASTLMAIKSAMLLPGGDPEMEELVDPREELVRQLIEYRRVKESGEELRRMREEASRRLPRGRAPLPEPPEDPGAEPPGVREVTLFDVFAAFHRLLRETEADEPRRIVYDDVPQERHIERILGVVGEVAGGAAALEALLGKRRDRPFVLGTFLALLELMKEGRILALQEGSDDAIIVVLADSEAGRSALESIRERARRVHEATPSGRPARRPPWRRGGEPGAGTAPGEPDAGAPPGESAAAPGAAGEDPSPPDPDSA